MPAANTIPASSKRPHHFTSVSSLVLAGLFQDKAFDKSVKREGDYNILSLMFCTRSAKHVETIQLKAIIMPPHRSFD
jgi:hypothetical protein